MTERDLLNMFLARDEDVLREVDERYGKQARAIAKRILGNAQDAEECWNDVLLRLWNAIPPAEPESMAAYVCTAVRNAALDRYDRQNADRRGRSQVPLLLDELGDCLPAGDNVEAEVQRRDTAEQLNRLLDSLSPDARQMFILRYVYLMGVREIAAQCGCSVSRVKVTLMRTRKKLHDLMEGAL